MAHLANTAAAVTPDHRPPARLAVTLAKQRREEVALAIEVAALELFATRPSAEVTVEEIALRAGVGVRTLYRYYPAKEDIFCAYPRRAARELAELVRARPASDTPFEAVRNAFCEQHPDPVELQRWTAAYANSDTHGRIARRAFDAMAAAFSEAIAARSGAPRDAMWVEMAGWMAASAIDIGARHAATQGGQTLDHVLAAWDVAGRGIVNIGTANIKSRRPPPGPDSRSPNSQPSPRSVAAGLDRSARGPGDEEDDLRRHHSPALAAPDMNVSARSGPPKWNVEGVAAPVIVLNRERHDRSQTSPRSGGWFAGRYRTLAR